MRARLVLLLSLGVIAISAAPASAAVHNGYCSPTGDFCQGVAKNKPKITLRIDTFSFRGRYKLCTRYASEHDYACQTFRLRSEGNGLYGSAIRWQRFFPHARHGRYFAKWFSAGYQVGPIIWFRT